MQHLIFPPTRLFPAVGNLVGDAYDIRGNGLGKFAPVARRLARTERKFFVRHQRFERRKPLNSDALLGDRTRLNDGLILIHQDETQLPADEPARVGPERQALAAAALEHRTEAQEIDSGVGFDHVAETA